MVEGKRNDPFRDGILIHLNIMCNNKGRFNANVYPHFLTLYTHKPLHIKLHKGFSKTEKK